MNSFAACRWIHDCLVCAYFSGILLGLHRCSGKNLCKSCKKLLSTSALQRCKINFELRWRLWSSLWNRCQCRMVFRNFSLRLPIYGFRADLCTSVVELSPWTASQDLSLCCWLQTWIAFLFLFQYLLLRLRSYHVRLTCSRSHIGVVVTHLSSSGVKLTTKIGSAFF